MKFTKLVKKTRMVALVAVAAIMLVPVTVSAITPGSIPAPTGSGSAGYTFPAFNIYKDVPGIGSEADFIRVKKDGEANSTLRNTVDTTCKTGDRFDVWFYVHNGAVASSNNNGSGSGVAHNVVAKVNLPTGEKTSFPISGGVTASNAQAISDGATINCGGQKFTMKYVNDSAQAFLDLPNKLVPLPQAIVSSGTPIGTNALDGNVWGCWDQRVWMSLKVEVVRVETPPPEEEPIVSKGECKVVDIKAEKGRKVTAKVIGSVTNAQIVGYKIDWGDGSTSSKQEDTHTYAKDGTYTIKTSVQIKLHDGTVVWKTAEACEASVTFKGDKPPVVVKKKKPPVAPKELPVTGPAGVAAAFVGVTGLSTLLYHRFGRRFF